MKTKSAFFAMLLAAVLVGCAREPDRRHIVILIDVSGSIERTALDQAFKAVDGLVSHLQRGDRIAIIPILGDAQAEIPGRILRFDIPARRQAYDADLRSFRLKLQASLTEVQANAMAHPASKTDILGSVALAAQELRMNAGKFARRELAILSDYIQEDSNLNFRKDERLANGRAASKFAVALTKANNPDFDRSVTVYLGVLRSKEYAELNSSRREALEEFWMKYVKNSGANPTFVLDGPGLLEKGLIDPM
jgi:hypothetical protein